METDSGVGNIKELPMEMQKILQTTNFPIKRKVLLTRERRAKQLLI